MVALIEMFKGKKCRLVNSPLVYYIEHDKLWYNYDGYQRPIMCWITTLSENDLWEII